MSPLFKRKDPVEKLVEKKLKWAEEEMAKGKTRHQVWKELLESNRLDMGVDVLTANNEAARIIDSLFYERNQRGSQLESEGRLAEAVKEYQANIHDGFSGTHPYERLRIIYAKHEDYKSALAVCEAFLQMHTRDDKKRERFLKWAVKYRAKL